MYFYSNFYEFFKFEFVSSKFGQYYKSFCISTNFYRWHIVPVAGMVHTRLSGMQARFCILLELLFSPDSLFTAEGSDADTSIRAA